MSLHQAIDLDRDLPDFSTKNVNFHPPTGISCLIVGAGVGGLTTALECRRKGHDVRVVERSPSPSTAGISTLKSLIPRQSLIFWD